MMTLIVIVLTALIVGLMAIGTWQVITAILDENIHRPYHWDDSLPLSDQAQVDALKYDTQFRLDNILLEIEQERKLKGK